MHTEPTISIQPEIDIISLKMLDILGCDTTDVTFKVRRRLFEGCDESNKTPLTDSLSEIENEDVQRASQTWNFDFYSESPLPAGRYAWEKIRNCDIPAWYTSENSVVHDKRLCIVPQRDGEECGENSQSSKEMDSAHYKLTARCDQENKSSSTRRRQILVQTHIKGYAKIQKKRTLKRQGSKNNSLHFLKGSHRVANYILRNQDDSTMS